METYLSEIGRRQCHKWREPMSNFNLYISNFLRKKLKGVKLNFYTHAAVTVDFRAQNRNLGFARTRAVKCKFFRVHNDALFIPTAIEI